MTDEEKAEEYADKILFDSKYPFIFNKEKVKAYIIKVYLDSLKCCEEAYNKGLAEGRKEFEEKISAQKIEFIKELKKENAELKEKVSYLEDNLRVARKDRKNLQLKVGKGLKEFIKDCPYSAFKLYANGFYAEQLTKAKELIKKLVNEFYYLCELYNFATDYECLAEAEQFIKESE